VAIGAGLVRFQGKSGPPGNLYVGPLMALFGPHAMSDVSPECVSKRKSANHSAFMGSRAGRPVPTQRDAPHDAARQ
jgi:hypothetical protein